MNSRHMMGYAKADILYEVSKTARSLPRVRWAWNKVFVWSARPLVAWADYGCGDSGERCRLKTSMYLCQFKASEKREKMHLKSKDCRGQCGSVCWRVALCTESLLV